MIESATGNLLDAQVDALVNTVNCVGIMGKGIALQFKQAFPDMFEDYARAAARGSIVPGRMHVYRLGRLWPKFIINFPTKRHWKGKSRIEDIDAGLVGLVEQVRALGIRSIAIPPLGSGNGGLDWQVVRSRIVRAFEPLGDVKVLLYEPRGEPPPDQRVVGTERPSLTVPRALYIALMGAYRRLDYCLTLLELQKLAYFLQVSGVQLRLTFERAPYGPYAHNLNQVLRKLDGHYLFGATDTKPGTEIRPSDGALREAAAFLELHSSAQDHLDRVSRLIDGFETPYGMELLATVHWAVRETPGAAHDLKSCIAAVHGWSPRKKRLMQPEHIKLSWDRLREDGWLTAPT